MQYITTLFGQVYGACAYGGSTTQTGACATAASNSFGGKTSSSNPLTNTGFDILLIVTLACTLMFIALMVRFWRRPKKQPPDVSAAI